MVTACCNKHSNRAVSSEVTGCGIKLTFGKTRSICAGGVRILLQ